MMDDIMNRFVAEIAWHEDVNGFDVKCKQTFVDPSDEEIKMFLDRIDEIKAEIVGRTTISLGSDKNAR